MALAAFFPLSRETISTKLAFLIREPKDEGDTDEGNCGQIRAEQIRKLIRRFEGTMRKPSAIDKDTEGRASVTKKDRRVVQLRTPTSRMETMKAQGSNTSTSIYDAAKVNEWRSDSDLPLPNFLTVLPRPESVPRRDKGNDAGYGEDFFGSVRQSQPISAQKQDTARLE